MCARMKARGHRIVVMYHTRGVDIEQFRLALPHTNAPPIPRRVARSAPRQRLADRELAASLEDAVNLREDLCKGAGFDASERGGVASGGSDVDGSGLVPAVKVVMFWPLHCNGQMQ